MKKTDEGEIMELVMLLKPDERHKVLVFARTLVSIHMKATESAVATRKKDDRAGGHFNRDSK